MTSVTWPSRRAPDHASVIELDSARCPSVSVIVPCYNYGHWLPGCVESTLCQNGVQVDLLVVNDASSDNSADVANALAAADPRVRVIHNRRNLGHIASVNNALREVDGEYVVKLDADDLLVEGSLSRATALLEARPSVGFAYGRALYFGQHLRNLPATHRWCRRQMLLPIDEPAGIKVGTRVSSWTVWEGRAWMSLLCRRAANCISQPEVVMRASALRAVGGYDPALPHTSDLAMWLRLASSGDVGHVDGAIQGLYRVHGASMQRTVNAGPLRDLRGRLAAFESVLADLAGQDPASTELLMLARRGLAREALTNACRDLDRGRVASEPVEDYVAFALATYPDARSLPQWTRLQRRRSLGGRWSPYYPPFLLGAAMRRVAEEVGAARWWRRGI
jgi:GT2 family glycosyltransferase